MIVVVLKVRDVQHLEVCFGPAWRIKDIRRALYMCSPVLFRLGKVFVNVNYCNEIGIDTSVKYVPYRNW